MNIALLSVVICFLSGYVFTSWILKASNTYERKRNGLRAIILAVAFIPFAAPLVFVYQFFEIGPVAHAELLCYGVGCFAFLHSNRHLLQPQEATKEISINSTQEG